VFFSATSSDASVSDQYIAAVECTRFFILSKQPSTNLFLYNKTLIMKTILRKIFLSAVALLLATAVHAYDFSAVNEDGVTIRYNILSASDKTCEVVGHNIAIFVGGAELIIPEKVEYASQTYTVTRIASASSRGMYNVVIPNSVTSIAPSAFKGSTSLQWAKLPDFLTSIEESVFEECTYLISISIPSSVKSIGNRAFYNCVKLKSVEIPNSVTSIGEYAFFKNDFTSIEIPNSVTTIQNYAFSYCEYLTSVKLPNAITSISDALFMGCKSLTSIEIPNSVTSIGQNAFDACFALISVKIPESVTSIGQSAFRSCDKLTSIDIPNSVTSIGKSAFERCRKMTSVTLGSSIESIGELAFASCNALVKVDTKIENPFKINENVFPTLVKTVAVLHVPKGRKAVYRTTEGWSDFVNVEEDGLYFHLTMPSGENFLAFCHDEPLDFSSVSGLKAYIAGGIDSSNGEVMMMSVEKVPAGTGVILQGTAGSSYDILVEKTSFVYFNLLKGTLSQTTISDGYVLRGDRFEQVSTPTTVAANSAYLVLPASVQGAQTLVLRLKNGVTDDIDAVVTDLAGGNRHWYTLQGARLNDVPTTPGIYIRNGRKVMVK
jgi:hypothetical protein